MSEGESLAARCGLARADASRISLLQWYQHKFNRSKLRMVMEAVNTAMSLLSVCVYVYDTYVSIPAIASSTYFACSLTFAVEYVAKLGAAPDLLRYLFWDWSLVDAATIIYGFAYFADEDLSSGFGFIRVLRIIQVVRLCKAVTSIVLQYSRRSSQPMQLEIVRRGADLAVTLVAVVFISACVFYELEVSTQDLELHNAIYWACVTISTVGYGDFAPTTVAGQLLFPLVFIIIIMILPRKISDLSSVMQAYSRYARTSHRSARFGLHVVLTGHVTHGSAQTFISEFFHKGRGYQEMDVVVLAPHDPAPELIITMNNSRWEKRVRYLSGSPFHAEDLARADTGRALAVYVLANKYAADPVAEDSRTLLAVLAVAQFLRQFGSPADLPPPRVVSWSTTSWKGRHEQASPFSHPHIIAQFLLNETLDNAIALLQSGAHHPPEVGLIPLNVSPFPICVGTLRASLLGASLHTPGLISLVSNLCISCLLERKRGLRKEDVSMLTGCGWLSEYLAGAASEIYDVAFPRRYWGSSFKQAALQLWRDEQVILIGLRYPQHEDPEEWFDVKLAPLHPCAPAAAASPDEAQGEGPPGESPGACCPPPGGGLSAGGGGDLVIGQHTVGYILSTEALVLGSASRGFRSAQDGLEEEEVDAGELGGAYLRHQQQQHPLRPPHQHQHSHLHPGAPPQTNTTSNWQAPQPDPASDPTSNGGTPPLAATPGPPLPPLPSPAQSLPLSPRHHHLYRLSLPRVDELTAGIATPAPGPKGDVALAAPLQEAGGGGVVPPAGFVNGTGAVGPLVAQTGEPATGDGSGSFAGACAGRAPSLRGLRTQSAPSWGYKNPEGWREDGPGTLGRVSRRGAAGVGVGVGVGVEAVVETVREAEAAVVAVKEEEEEEELEEEAGALGRLPPGRRGWGWLGLRAPRTAAAAGARPAAKSLPPASEVGDDNRSLHATSGNWLSRQSAAITRYLTAAIARSSGDIAAAATAVAASAAAAAAQRPNTGTAVGTLGNGVGTVPCLEAGSAPVPLYSTADGSGAPSCGGTGGCGGGQIFSRRQFLSRVSLGSKSVMARFAPGAAGGAGGSRLDGPLDAFDAPGPFDRSRGFLARHRVKSMLTLQETYGGASGGGSAYDASSSAAAGGGGGAGGSDGRSAAAAAAAAAATRTRRQQGFKATAKALDLHALAAVNSFTYRRAITRRVSRGGSINSDSGTAGGSPPLAGRAAVRAEVAAGLGWPLSPATPGPDGTQQPEAPAATPPAPRTVATFADRGPLDSPIIISGSSCFSQLVHVVAAVRSAPPVGRARHFHRCPIVIIDSGDATPLTDNQLEALACLPASRPESIFVLRANLTDPRDLEKLNLRRGRTVDALVLPSLDQYMEEAVAGSCPALADGQVLLAANALRRYCEEMDCDLRVVTEVLALLNCSYALPLCLADGPYNTHSRATLMGVNLTTHLAPHMAAPSRAASARSLGGGPPRVEFLTDPRPDFRRSVELSVRRLRRSPQSRQEELLQHFLAKMPHLTPALAPGHILMQTFMDALSCQTIFNPMMLQILLKMINCWDSASGQQQQQAQRRHHHQRHRQEQHRAVRKQTALKRQNRVLPPSLQPQQQQQQRQQQPPLTRPVVASPPAAAGSGGAAPGATAADPREPQPLSSALLGGGGGLGLGLGEGMAANGTVRIILEPTPQQQQQQQQQPRSSMPPASLPPRPGTPTATLNPGAGSQAPATLPLSPPPQPLAPLQPADVAAADAAVAVGAAVAIAEVGGSSAPLAAAASAAATLVEARATAEAPHPPHPPPQVATGHSGAGGASRELLWDGLTAPGTERLPPLPAPPEIPRPSAPPMLLLPSPPPGPYPARVGAPAADPAGPPLPSPSVAAGGGAGLGAGRFPTRQALSPSRFQRQALAGSNTAKERDQAPLPAQAPEEAASAGGPMAPGAGSVGAEALGASGCDQPPGSPAPAGGRGIAASGARKAAESSTEEGGDSGDSSGDSDNSTCSASACASASGSTTVRVFSLNYRTLVERVPRLKDRLRAQQQRQQLQRQRQSRQGPAAGSGATRPGAEDLDPDPDLEPKYPPELVSVLVDPVAQGGGEGEPGQGGAGDGAWAEAVSFGALFEVLVEHYDMLPLGLYRRDAGGVTGKAGDPSAQGAQQQRRQGSLRHRGAKGQQGQAGCAGGSGGLFQSCGFGGRGGNEATAPGGGSGGGVGGDDPTPAPRGGDYGRGAAASGMPYVYTKPDGDTTWLRPSDDVYVLTCQLVVTGLLGGSRREGGV